MGIRDDVFSICSQMTTLRGPGASSCSSSLNLKRLNAVKQPLISPGQRMDVPEDFIPQRRNPHLPISCYPTSFPIFKNYSFGKLLQKSIMKLYPTIPPSTSPGTHLWQGSADPELGWHPWRGSAEPRELVPHPRVFFHILFLVKIKLLLRCASSCWQHVLLAVNSSLRLDTVSVLQWVVTSLLKTSFCSWICSCCYTHKGSMLIPLKTIIRISLTFYYQALPSFPFYTLPVSSKRMASADGKKKKDDES